MDCVVLVGESACVGGGRSYGGVGGVVFEVVEAAGGAVDAECWRRW